MEKDPYHWTMIVGLSEKMFGKKDHCQNGSHFRRGKKNDPQERWTCEVCGAVITKSKE